MGTLRTKDGGLERTQGSSLSLLVHSSKTALSAQLTSSSVPAQFLRFSPIQGFLGACRIGYYRNICLLSLVASTKIHPLSFLCHPERGKAIEYEFILSVGSASKIDTFIDSERDSRKQEEIPVYPGSAASLGQEGRL